jgi:SAM-dependent methyltransferase
MNWWKIAGVSFLILFSELLVIRLLGTEIRIFAYLGNLTLLMIFLGSGIGMYIKKTLPLSWTAVAFFLLAALVTTSYILRTPRFDVKLFSGISELLAPLSESYVWQSLNTFSKTGAVLGLGLTLGVLGLTAFGFMPLGNLLGKLLEKDPRPLRAYSINIAASLSGMWALQIFSLGQLPPLLGLTLAIWALIFLEENQTARAVIMAVAVATIALTIPKIANQPYEGPTTFWSPYQKLTLSLINKTKIQQPPGYYLEVNNVGYMGLLNLGPEHQATVSAWAKTTDVLFQDQYLIPYRFKPNPENVLIIGAGGGNDAYGAIRGGAKNVDAVEIDPVIVQIGKKYHPNLPYQDSRVNLVTADGRAFMEKTNKRYDLIVMGLADSHTLSSSLTNLRLDHYLYTKESLEKAKQLLKPDGILVLSFEVPRQWIGQRLSKTVTEVFGLNPVTFEVRSDGAFGWGGYFFVASKDPDLLPRILNNNPDLANFIKKHEKSFPSLTINSLTDDWPYLYLDFPRLPALHLIIAGIAIGGFLFTRKIIRKGSGFNWPMFWWGAGFMLFEFQNITKLSLLFGLTWQTNIVVISAALIMILLANWVVERKAISSRVAFIGLMAALAIQAVVPVKLFNALADFPKILIAGTVFNLPFFFGGAIFSGWFKNAKDKKAAFAGNLLGSAAGGLMEMFSFLLGIKAIIFMAAAMYGLGWIAASKKFGKISRR